MIATMQYNRKGQKLIFISIIFTMLFSFPFLAMANKQNQWMHFPVLYVYLFITWGVYIFLVWLITDRK